MIIKFKDTPEQNQLIQAMGSRNMATSLAAQEAFAKFIGPVVQVLLKKAGFASQIYQDAPYNADTDNPSYPLDLYYNEGAGLVQVWSQNMAGGLPTSEVWGLQELKLMTYRLDSAVSFSKRYARKARLDVVAKAVERMTQEILVKQELNAWAVICKATAEANTPLMGGQAFGGFTNTYNKHILPSATANVFTLGDLNNLLNLIQRINTSFDGGTPVAPYSDGITDLYMSPEIMAQVRAMSFNPIFATSVSSPSTSVTQLPPNVREEIYRNAGTNSFYGTNLVQMNEFGINKKYNKLFDSFTTNQNVPGSSTNTWAGYATDEVMIGVDNRRGAFVRPVAKDGETGSTVVIETDDQYNLKRVDKAGFFTAIQEGRICLDARAIAAIVV